jgi:hypothetical protein
MLAGTPTSATDGNGNYIFEELCQFSTSTKQTTLLNSELKKSYFKLYSIKELK